MAKKTRLEGEPIIIKKYANRRLYNTDSSSYVTLDDLAQMVKENIDFVVRDAKSGDDITHTVLTQIIFEEESKEETLLPINFLRQLITFYGDGLQKVVPEYLESSMAAFSQNQEKFRSFIDGNRTKPAEGMPQLMPFEEMAKQNMAIFEKTMSMFSPFGARRGATQGEQAAGDTSAAQTEPEKKSEKGSDTGVDADQLADLQTQLAEMQAQINNLQKK
ncbi:MAG: polyhydroxyalkanoate synthesis repressor PhaR [Alphaproteobacteria bacterium]|nr:MAG: polyhydroxyalkanoate synthesis repressor PhaR [Alphaproteobacteria bacterium]